MPKKSHLSLTLGKLRRRLFTHYRATRTIILISALILLITSFFFIFKPLLGIAMNFIFGPVNIFSVILPKKHTLKTTDGKTNILILGIGDKSHDGPNLTDTMIIASIPNLPDDKTATSAAIGLVSVPRDIYLDYLDGKINSAYAIGVEKDATSGAGLTLAKSAASLVTGLPIHYGFRIDFSAFRELIDTLDGVDINVERVLDDPYYPITGKEDDNCNFSPQEIESRLATASAEKALAFSCRYEHLYIPAGPTHMNGSLALKYVRSRHAEGDEGTDFARSRRQELLITALKNKVFSNQTFLNLGKIEQVYNLLKSNIDTDIDPADTNNFLALALKYRHLSLKTIVLDMNFFDNPPVDARGWILLPKNNSWDEIHQYIKQQLPSPN